MLDSLLECVGDRIGVRHVAMDRQRGVGCSERLEGLGEQVFLDVEQRDLPAFRQKPLRGGKPDAARSARHQRDLPLSLGHVPSRFLIDAVCALHGIDHFSQSATTTSHMGRAA